MAFRKVSLYRVEKLHHGAWTPASVAADSCGYGYGRGWINAMDEIYPSAPHRLINITTGETVYKTRGRGVTG